MDLFDTTQMAIGRAAEAVSLRQQVIADNLANANTPGFRRSDVNFYDSLGTAMSQGKEAIADVEFSAAIDETAALRGDGSNMDIDKEQSTLAQTGLEFDALTQIYKSRTAILRSAIGPGA